MRDVSLESVPMVPAGALLALPPRLVIDLRSPAEYAEDHLPGACNVPLLDDLERALIGTLYARRSPRTAFEEAGERVRARIGGFTARVAELAGWEVPAVDLEARVERLTAPGIERLEQELVPESCDSVPRGAVVFCCWRGGLRSRCVVAFLRALGLEAVGLLGGYRSYRRMVRGELEAWRAPPSFVLRGLTGVGKTLVLRELERRRPEWVVDLEGCAGHRSSILGGVGLCPASQKLFETRLAARIRRGFAGACVLEGESRKVGDVVLLSSVWQALVSGCALELVTTRERRIRVLVEDYLAAPGSRGELARALPFIEERLGARRWKGVLVALLEARREEELVALLFERYYDPLYRHSEKSWHPEARFDSTDPARAALAIERWIEARLSPVARHPLRAGL